MRLFTRLCLALLASLLLAAATRALIRPLALIVLGATGAENVVVGIAIVGNIVAVPLVAGITLGIIARSHLLLLSVICVIVSLLGTFITLGPSGLPHGAKILAYGLQLTLLYAAARWSAAWRRERRLHDTDTAKIPLRG